MHTLVGRDGAEYHARFCEPAVLPFGPIALSFEQTTGEADPEESMQSAVWDAAAVLADSMRQESLFPASFWDGKVVLEVGSGCGVCGIAAAKLGAREVLLTDYAQLLPLLSRNAALNGVEGRCRALPLEWGRHGLQAFERACGGALPHVDVIVGSDVTTFIQSLGELAETVDALCAAGTEVYIAHHHRGTDARFFFDEFAPSFEREELELPPASRGPDGRVSVYRLTRRAADGGLVDGVEQAVPERTLDRALRGDVRDLKRWLASGEASAD